jgi:hypothetical protein
MMELPLAEVQMAQKMVDQQKQQMLMQMGIQNPMQSPVGSQIEEMFNQPIIPINEYDNHQAHLEEHGYFMKQQTYENLPPEIKDQFLKHWKAHETKLQQGALDQLMQGAPSGMGGPPKTNGGANQFSGLPPAADNSAPVDAQAAA